MIKIDFHTHILPAVDDGSQDIRLSLEMLQEETRQGIDVVVLTPHFYGWRDRIENFIDKRNKAFQELAEATKEGLYPVLVCGCEAAYFNGMSNAPGIEQLTIDSTKTLMLEMPMQEWSQTMVDEVIEMKRNGFNIVLAHIERYLEENSRQVGNLLDSGVLLQVNGGSLAKWPGNRKLLKMFEQGRAHVIGSDCHSMGRRRPNMEEARKAVGKKLGNAKLDEIDRLGTMLIGKEE